MNLQLIINGISLGAVYAVIAVGFALIYSILKFSNFAQGGVIGITAYIAYFFQAAFDPTPPLFVTILVASVSGMFMLLLVDLIGFRQIRKKDIPRIYYFLSSITIGIMMESLMNITFGQNSYGFPAVFKKTSIQLGGLTISTMDMMVLCVSVALLIVMIVLIDKTKLGRAIRAVSVNPNTSKLMGINSDFIIIMSFMMAGALAGVAGVFLGIKYSVYPALGSSMIFKGFMASVVGGLGSLGGAITGAFALGLLEMVLVYYCGSSITPAIVLSILLLFLLIRPQGISGRLAQDKA